MMSEVPSSAAIQIETTDVENLDLSSSQVPLLSMDTSNNATKPKKLRSPISLISSESLRLYFTSVIKRLSERITLDSLRPLPMFLGIQRNSFDLSSGAFNVPFQQSTASLEAQHKNLPAKPILWWDRLKTRINLNVALFLTNYALVASGVAVVIALLNPFMILVVQLVAALWWFHQYLLHHEVQLGFLSSSYTVNTILTINQRSTLLSIITVLAVVWKCLVPILSFVFVSGTLILAHAVLRDPSHIEMQLHEDGSHQFSRDQRSILRESNTKLERDDII